jgi:hypothetical protein
MKDLTQARPTQITRSRVLNGNRTLRKFMSANDNYFSWDGLMKVADHIESTIKTVLDEPWLISIERQEDLTYKCQISFFSTTNFEKHVVLDFISDDRKGCLWLACVGFASWHMHANTH